MPSKKVLKEKQAAVEQLAEKLQKAKSGVLMDYRGITVEQDTELRNQLRKSNIEYKVVKNSLTRFASQKVGFEQFDSFLHGPTSMAISYDDPVAPAKVLSDFAKKNDKVSLKVGFLDGEIIDVNQIKALADLPSKEVLVAMVLGGLNAPISGFANVLNANLRGLVVALNAIAEKKGEVADA